MRTRTTTESFARALEAHRVPIDAALEAALAWHAAAPTPGRLSEALRYALLGPGKRVRPTLCLLTAEALGLAAEEAMPAAVALECIHAYSLVHDDLPCMDDDALRRGRPTVHVAYDEATAVLVGDGLQGLAFQVLAAQEDPARVQRQVRLLADASGSGGMVGGQARDMQAEGQEASLEHVLALHRGKTGALLQASFGLAAAMVEDEVRDWRPFGDAVGLLFQATDDLLDATATSETLGKTAGKDAATAKATLAAVLGLDGLEALVQEQVTAAEGALAVLDLPAGPAQAALAELPRFLAARAH
jgi:farnesyl diphosphate synthase